MYLVINIHIGVALHTLLPTNNDMPFNNDYGDDSFIPCPHCGRTYNEAAANRHIPLCKSIINKPKSLNRGSGAPSYSTRTFGKNRTDVAFPSYNNAPSVANYVKDAKHNSLPYHGEGNPTAVREVSGRKVQRESALRQNSTNSFKKVLPSDHNYNNNLNAHARGKTPRNLSGRPLN